MAFFVKIPEAIVSVISQSFQGEPNGTQTGFRLKLSSIWML